MKDLIQQADLQGLEAALSNNPALANTEIPIEGEGSALAHPLHRICDGVFSGAYTDEQGRQMAAIFLAHGAKIEGNHPQPLKDSPLVAAASLNADQVGLLYLDSGANIEHPGCHGGTALHWAAWCGRPVLVKKLLDAGAPINLRCHDFRSTPLFWAAHGLSSNGHGRLEEYKECVRLLLDAGADKSIPNLEGTYAYQMVADEELKNWLKL